MPAISVGILVHLSPMFIPYDLMSEVALDIICETTPDHRSAQSILVSLGGPTAAVHCHWFGIFRKSHVAAQAAQQAYLAPTAIMTNFTDRIERVASEILQGKLTDSAIRVPDTDAKRDIMSLLARARKANLAQGKSGYAMSDQAMMDQDIRSSRSAND
ncbi:hypothetical protein BD779DRAFT_1476241 [Infundibulicybe gibba]|nr:hypothetical protein BD779DRAFT_1476241 [Infundibulicybe gibba]